MCLDGSYMKMFVGLVKRRISVTICRLKDSKAYHILSCHLDYIKSQRHTNLDLDCSQVAPLHGSP